MSNLKFSNINHFIGHEFPPTPWMEVSQASINAFADCIGDHQWIHVDVERCKAESPFKLPVAHGPLLLSLLAGQLINSCLVPTDLKQAINLGYDKVRFLLPVCVGSKVRAKGTYTSIEDKGAGRLKVTIQALLEIEGADKPAVSAEILMMFMGE